MNPKQIAQYLRQLLGADAIKELRGELAPAYEEVTTNRGVSIVEFRCRSAVEQTQLADFLRLHQLDVGTNYALVQGREYFAVRPYGAIGLATARDFVKGFK